MKASEIREMSLDEMIGKRNDIKQELLNFRFQHGSNQLENTSKLKLTKKDLARVNTIIREFEIKQQEKKSGS